MAKKIKNDNMLSKLTTSELKRLLAARERIDVLEAERDRLLKELAGVERELQKLMTGASARRGGATSRAGSSRKQTVRKRTAKKKTTKRKTTRKKAQRTARQAAKKSLAKKAASRSAARGKTAQRVPLEDVIVSVLRKAGGKLSFKDLHETIVKGKLYRSRAAKFDNVLRRTLSTSKKVKRVGRGVYAVA